MADMTNNQPVSGKPNVMPTRARPFYRNRLVLQLVTIVAVVLAFCLGISIFFKVDTITVFGADRYSAWTVAEASGIREGDNLLFFGRGTAAGRVKLALPYVDDVRITIHLPGTVNIYVEEVSVVYSIKDDAGNWWLMTADGRLTEQVNAAGAGDCTAIKGVVIQNPRAGETAVAWEALSPTDAAGSQQLSAATNADRLRAALNILQQMERNEILGEAAFIDVSNLQQLVLQYGDRFEVWLGNSMAMDEKIPVMKSAILQMGEFQTGILEIVKADGKWQVVYTQP